MDKQHFENLIAGVRQMKTYMAGETVKGIRVSDVTKTKTGSIEVSKIRLSAKLTQGNSQHVLA